MYHRRTGAQVTQVLENAFGIPGFPFPAFAWPGTKQFLFSYDANSGFGQCQALRQWSHRDAQGVICGKEILPVADRAHLYAVCGQQFEQHFPPSRRLGGK